MLVNSDFSLRAIVPPERQHWVASPQAGVERVMLDRVGGEIARATSLVRYAEGSHFPRHMHPGGEEILVLSGTFSADGEDYPAGWYLRNPPGSSHLPSSEPGALIFVKLKQMRADDGATVRVDTTDATNWWRVGGLDVCVLHHDYPERVALEKLPAGEAPSVGLDGGAELLVLEGELLLDHTHLNRGSWLRLPPGDTAKVVAAGGGATVYVKTGHLGSAGEPA